MAGPITSLLSLVPLLFLVGVCLTPPCLSAAPCPRSCTCAQPTDLHCTFRSLLSVPLNINCNVERINLGYNSISQLSEKSLSGLTRLEVLLMHGNELQSIPDGAFKDLSAVQMLKLSFNRLREVSRHTFMGLWSLARLHLDHNGLESIDADAFHGLTSLKLLQLEGNRIKQLHASTFSTFTVLERFHVSTIKHLYLCNNSLSALPEELLLNMPQLENLFLHSNPWVCDCNMRWMHRWLQAYPDVLKCKKNRTLPGGQLCPMCSSPTNLHQKPLQILDTMVCSSPIVKSKDRHTTPEEAENDLTFLDDVRQSFGNISLGLSDEHGNEAELECGIGEPRGASKITFEQKENDKMVTNVTLSLDLDCDVDREKYERLWRLIAYYSNVPAHLKRGIMLTKDPYPAYVYKQDSDKDALYYTGVKANIVALPTWLMQAYLDLQLNRHGSSGKTVKLTLMTQLSQHLDLEMVRRQPRTWVTIEKPNWTLKTVVVDKAFDLQCSVLSASEPIITWILPDGTKLKAPSGNIDKRLSISADGRLVIQTAEHKDAGNYYCIAKVNEDFAVLPFYVSVHDSSNPEPGKSQATPTELLAGNALNLDCDALGSPHPEVNWIIPNGNIVSFRSNLTRVFVHSNGTLHIPQSLPPDNGFYKCVALNRYGMDTKVVKVTVNRRPGAVRTMRRFPMRPQSAAGVNTKIKVPITDFEDGSGDTEEASDSKPVRKTLPVRNGAHPSRNTWRRLPMRKPNLQNTENGKDMHDFRRRLNAAKISPERLRELLEKVWVKNGQFPTTASPVIATTAKLTTQFRELTTLTQEETSLEQYATTYAQDLTSLAHEAIEGSSDGVREKAGQALTAEPEITSMLPTTTLEPLTSQSFPSLKQTALSNAFFPPQTTPAPLQPVTLWQEKLNTLSKSTTFSQQQDIEVDGVKAADSKRLKPKGNRKNKPRLSKGRQVVPTVVPVTSNAHDKLILSTQKPKLETIFTVSPTTVNIWKKQSSTQQQSSKRGNGNRKKKPNRNKNKHNKNVKHNGLLSDSQKVLASSEPSIPVQKGQEPTVSTKSHKTGTKKRSKLSKTKLFSNNQVEGFITAFPENGLDTLPLNSQHKFTNRPLAPVKPLAQTPMQNAIADSSSREQKLAKRKIIQSRRENTAPKGEKHLANGNRKQIGNSALLLRFLAKPKVEEKQKSEQGATTGIDVEALTATKLPETSYKTSSQNTRQDSLENASLFTSTTTALPMSSSHFTSPKMATTESEFEESDELSTSISDNTKTPYSQSESLMYLNAATSRTTVTPQMFKVTAQQASGKSNSPYTVNQQPTFITQLPSTFISPETDDQRQATPAISNSLQSEAPSLLSDAAQQSLMNSKTTIPPLLLKVTTKKAPVTKGSQKINNGGQSNEESSTPSPPASIKSTTFMPSTPSSRTPQVPSISTSQKTTKENQNIQAKSTISTTFMPSIPSNRTPQVPSISTSQKTTKENQNIQVKSTTSSHAVVQNTILPPTLPSPDIQQASSLSVSPKIDQNNQASTQQTSDAPLIDATQQPTQTTSAFLDLVTQSSNHRTKQFITLNPTSLAISLRTTPAPTYRPSLVMDLWTERPRVRTTPKLPALATSARGKPWIVRGNFQTMSVKAETDAVLPCTASGEPKPFLSWTKVSTGASIPQNSRLQRFEVHKNGTLIIRNTQPLDGGEYVCTVQNQYGQDQALTNLVVLSQHPKILQPRHRDVSVTMGSDIDINCQVEGHPKPRVTWVLPNHAQIVATARGVAPQNRVSILPNGTLRIIQAGFSDRGIYKCVGSSTSGADTVSVRLYVSALPPVFKQTAIENITASEDDAIFLHCAANGSPPPTIRWTMPDSIQLTSSQYLNGRKTMVFPNGTLFVQSLTQGNAGKYECLASNVLGSSKRTVNLVVKSKMLMAKASITMSSAKLTEVIYGGELKLDCVANGDPPPRVIWRTPSRKLVDSQYSFDPRIRVFSNGSITVHSVTDRDGGEYLCVARNKLGDDYVVLRVEVLTRPAKIEHKARRSSQEVIYGGDLKVDCVASGLPNPEISWALPDGTMVNPDKQQRASPGRRRRYVVFDNGTLFFNDVGMREEGDYTCYAQNELGKDEMKIHVKVKSASSAPVILDKTQTSSVQVVYGRNFTLHCDAKGEPTPAFTWISPMNRIIVTTKDKYQVSNDGKLVVQKAKRFDAGDYTCAARNHAGHDSKVIKVEVLVMPPDISSRHGQNAKVAVIENERILLDCVAKGTPNPRVMWVLPGNVILPLAYHSNRIRVHQNGTLDILSAKRSDAGQLACIARNEGGEVRSAVSLEVIEAKNANQMLVSGSKMETVVLTVGNAMTLSCVSDGKNVPPVTWLLPNSTPLQSGARFKKFSHLQDGSLVISNPSLAEAGTYRCLGRHHNGGQFEGVVQLVPGRKPEITNSYDSSISIMHGEMLMLHCVSNGEPLRLTWTLPSGVILNRPQKAGRYSVLPNGTLAIQQISVYDRGSYVCRVTNEYGSATVSAPVIVVAYPPQITNGPNAVTYTRSGVAIQLNCAATGSPSAEVSWETPDKTRHVIGSYPRLFGNKYLHPQGSLVIQNPTKRDAGVYKCTARNILGVDSKTTYLNVY